jgi:hypothetical protein
LHRFANQPTPVLPGMTPMVTTAKELFGILNLNHWDLFEIWFLVLGIFIFFID